MRFSSGIVSSLCAALLIGGASLAVLGQNAAAPQTVKVRRAAQPPRVDGKLDDAVWKDAARVVLGAALGGPPAEAPTEAWLAYDATHLFLAFRCPDPDIWTAHRGRDAHMWTEDVVEAFIDLDPADPEYVELEVNPHGDLFDGLFFERHKKVLMSWNPDIQVKVVVDGTVDQRGDKDRAWTVEMAIPIGDLTPSSGVGRPGAAIQPGTTWGLNLYRGERSGNAEKSRLEAWSPVKGDFHETTLFGRIVFE